jgi:hypothetical protein
LLQVLAVLSLRITSANMTEAVSEDSTAGSSARHLVGDCTPLTHTINLLSGHVAWCTKLAPSCKKKQYNTIHVWDLHVLD